MKFVLKKFVVQKFVNKKFVIIKFVIARFVIMKFIITKLVITKLYLQSSKLCSCVCNCKLSKYRNLNFQTIVFFTYQTIKPSITEQLTREKLSIYQYQLMKLNYQTNDYNLMYFDSVSISTLLLL